MAGAWALILGSYGGGTGVSAVGFVELEVTSRRPTITFQGRGVAGVMAGDISVLTEKAGERSTYVVNLVAKDEDGTVVTPDSMTYTLIRKSDHEVVNDRQDEVVTPSTSMDVVLSGADLQRFGVDDDGLRRVTAEGTYSSSLGSGLPCTAEAELEITQHRGTPD